MGLERYFENEEKVSFKLETWEEFEKKLKDYNSPEYKIWHKNRLSGKLCQTRGRM